MVKAVMNENIHSLQLIIYDLLGKEVATEVDKQESPRNYKVNFNAFIYSSGVNFNKTQSDGYI